MGIRERLGPIRHREIRIRFLGCAERLARLLVLEAVQQCQPALEWLLGRPRARIRKGNLTELLPRPMAVRFLRRNRWTGGEQQRNRRGRRAMKSGSHWTGALAGGEACFVFSLH